MRRHGEYLKVLFDRAAPYGMLPAGICESELEDRETFPLLHLQVDFDEQRPHYKKQLEAGVPLGNRYCIGRSPYGSRSAETAPSIWLWANPLPFWAAISGTRRSWT